MKRWRIAQFHPEDRYEIDDDVADKLRTEIREVESKIKDAPTALLNQLFLERRKIHVELAERLYGK